MYFVHPQIKFNNLNKVFLSLTKSVNTEGLNRKLSSYFPGKDFIFTDMGRSAFKLIVEKFNLQNSEILFPAYICDIFEPILKQYNIKPIFLDVDLKTFHIKTEEIIKKITPQTRAILACHTYGLPIDIQRIKKINSELRTPNSQLLIIEDCAHSFGARVDNIFTGNLGDVAFFSLYKQFPTLRGGMAVFPQCNEERPRYIQELEETRFNFRDFLSLLNNFSFFAYLFKKFGGEIAPKMIRKEKLSKPGGINRVSLNLFSNFLEDFEKTLEKRKELALFFQKELSSLNFEVQELKGNVFCYLSALVPKNLSGERDRIVQELRTYGIFCTRIWHTPIILNPEVQRRYNIDLNEFPSTLDAAKRIINFPLQNYYIFEDIKKIIVSLKKTISQNI